jgi:putative transposase
MPQSHSSVHLHAVFSTKERRPWLKDEKFRIEVYDYIAEVSNRLGCPLVAIGGVQDHVHLLTRFSRTLSMADWMKEVKRVSSTFIKERIPEFYWQGGYGIFGVDSSAFQPVVAYIRNQEQHHHEISFQDEFRRLMVEHGIEWDERYVWD